MVDSTSSSAVFSEGQVTVTNCSFARCATGTNNVMRSLEASITSGGAALRALGGAIQAVGVEAALLSTGSSFVACLAQGGKYNNYGGAVYAFAMVRIDSSRFEANHVEGGTDDSGGSALYIEARRLEIATSAFISNKARAHFQAYGGAVRVRDCAASMSLIMERLPNFCNVAPSDCGVQLRAVTFVGNAASGGPGTSRIKGGAIYMATELLCVNVTDSSFVANSAEDSVGNTEAGAVQVYDKAVLKIATTTFVGNTAKGATDQVRCPTLHQPTRGWARTWWARSQPQASRPFEFPVPLCKPAASGAEPSISARLESSKWEVGSCSSGTTLVTVVARLKGVPLP